MSWVFCQHSNWVPLLRGRRVPITLGWGAAISAFVVFSWFVSEKKPTNDVPVDYVLPETEVDVLYAPGSVASSCGPH